MSDQSMGTAPEAAIVPPAIEPPKPVVPVGALPEDALKPRLEAAKATGRNDLLRELGVTDTAQLKAALDTIKTAEDAKKSDAEKLALHLSELAQTRATLADATAAIESVWAAESVKLTPEQLTAVDSLGGQNVAAKVRALNVLRPTWIAAPVAVPPVELANTSPAPNAPTTTTTSPANHKSIYESLAKENPVQAARYLARFERDIFPA